MAEKNNKEKSKQKKKRKIDFILLFTVFVLIALGLIMVYSASWPESLLKNGETDVFFKNQLKAMVIGLVFMWFGAIIDYRVWRRLRIPIFVLGVILNLLIFSPFGQEHMGAYRWVRLGGFEFMPSDALKLASIVAVSGFLANNKNEIGSFKRTAQLVAIIMIVVGLIILQSDLGTSAVIVATLGVVAFIGGLRLPYAFLGVIGGAAFIFLAIYFEPYRFKRFMVFRNPFEDRLGTGMQAVQSLYALGSGGVTGLGLGKSVQKYFYLSLCYNDFIFSILGEELGLIGSLAYITLLLIFVFRGFSIANNVKDPFGKYLATGITFLIFSQSLLHVLVALSALPTKGITLPFISYGGTSLVVFMAMSGILLNISKHREEVD
ncbi:MAG: putative lipid II flippase FtsW [Tissierellia bacterium]|nr:putative lipid II flippase FtsW [Tissierellia bacterium]